MVSTPPGPTGPTALVWSCSDSWLGLRASACQWERVNLPGQQALTLSDARFQTYEFLLSSSPSGCGNWQSPNDVPNRLGYPAHYTRNQCRPGYGTNHRDPAGCNRTVRGQRAPAANGMQGQLEGNGVLVVTSLNVLFPGSVPTKTANKVLWT